MAKSLKEIELSLKGKNDIIHSAVNNNNIKPTKAHIEAINHLFTELELAYHNQFHKAFPDNKSLTMAKQLWLRLLIDYSPEEISKATRLTICDNTFLPTPNNIRDYCEKIIKSAIPDVKTAYKEACLSYEPRSSYKWSHPIVYHAGKATDWFFLNNQTEAATFPVFERNYEILLNRIRNGDKLEIPINLGLKEENLNTVDKDKLKEKLSKLRKDLNI
tara:strand:- start:2645 stop:3295 length:651 start_codon:yes stop_codon:yes gene_type:complete